MKLRLIFAILSSCLISAAMAQDELPDLLGQWDYVVEGQEAHPQCGEAIQVGELVVERKIAARAWRGKARGEQSFENCPGITVTVSAATIRIKDGNLITIDYDEDGWSMDRLRLVDGVMNGEYGNGVTSRWVWAEEDDARLSEEQLAELEEFLGEVEPELKAELGKLFTERLEKNLLKTGLNQSESGQVAALTVTRMTSCMTMALRESVLKYEMPLEQVLAGQSAAFIFNPQDPDPLIAECIDAAERNAGVRIR